MGDNADGLAQLLQGLQSDSSDLEQQIQKEFEVIADLRQCIVSEVKSNYVMEHELQELDEKIKLLIKNRISIQEVMAHSQGLSQMKNVVENTSKLGGNKRACTTTKDRTSVRYRRRSKQTAKRSSHC
eukprot:GFYU01028156.1.p1 GENE.GFYU01028156.1~~GFYU01028156.1.p1  ORF type:complete len:138 (-),score=37.18 GFYU01028156.1:696-1076(-)